MSRIRIGNFNLFNLVLPEKTFYGKRTYSHEEYQKKLHWIRQQLSLMNASLIGFQEVFHQQAFQEIFKRIPIYKNASYVSPGEDGVYPRVALLSMFPILSYKSISAFPKNARLDIDASPIPLSEFRRPVLHAVIDMPVGPVTVFVCHLKSKRPIVPDEEDAHDPYVRSLGQARSLIIRAAESVAIRHLILKEIQGNSRPVILMGDLNSMGTAVTSRMISGDPPSRHWPAAHKKKAWDTVLYHAQDIQTRQSYRDVYYTYIHNGFYESLDHILFSQEFYRQNRKHIGYVEYTAVLNDHLIDTTLSEEKVPVWQSDHGQVVSTVNLIK